MSPVSPKTTPSPEAQAFLNAEHRLLIGGEWVASSSGETIEVFDPSSEAHLATVQAGNSNDIDRAVLAARAAFRGPWSKLTAYERTRLIWKLADELEANLGLASELEVLDNGMPLMIAQYSIAAFGCEFCATTPAGLPRLRVTPFPYPQLEFVMESH